MEKFFGKFTFLPDKTEGLEEFADAMALPDAVKDALRNNKTAIISIEANADGSYRDTTDYGGGNVEVFDFRLGETVEAVALGMKLRNVFRLEGDRVVGESQTVGTDNVTKSYRYWKGEFLAVDMECKGAVMRTYYKKI